MRPPALWILLCRVVQYLVQLADEVLIFKWFAKKRRRAGVECIVASGHVVVAGDHDDGDAAAIFVKALLQLQPGHAGHLYIEDHAVGRGFRGSFGDGEKIVR